MAPTRFSDAQANAALKAMLSKEEDDNGNRLIDYLERDISTVVWGLVSERHLYSGNAKNTWVTELFFSEGLVLGTPVDSLEIFCEFNDAGTEVLHIGWEGS